MYIGTANPNKRREFGDMLVGLGVDVKFLDADVPETADTIAGNARQKAHAYAAMAPGEWVMAEDSGLVVPNLDGMPGPWSARFHALDLESKEVRVPIKSSLAEKWNTIRLLDMMREWPPEDRYAYFEAVVVVVGPDGKEAYIGRSVAHGAITTASRGTDGWGYDSVFVSARSGGKTWAEIPVELKNEISHRADAVRKLQVWASGCKGLR
jgi:XTP/dITP diphosphohydrolase